MNTEEKLSEILKNLAEVLLLAPDKTPSSEAAHAALLVAQVGWNRTLGHPSPDFQKVLTKFEKSRPKLWRELISRDLDELISRVEQEKNCRYPADQRIILVCGIVPPGKVHVEWCYKKDLPKATKDVDRLINNPPPSWRKINV